MTLPHSKLPFKLPLTIEENRGHWIADADGEAVVHDICLPEARYFVLAANHFEEAIRLLKKASNMNRTDEVKLFLKLVESKSK